MKPGKIDQLLEKIRDAIPDLEDVDEKGREILKDLEQDVRRLLDGDKDKPEETVLERMKSAVDHFEVTHPTLTAMISEASAILSGAGI
jgi:hypothetical protein